MKSSKVVSFAVIGFIALIGIRNPETAYGITEGAALRKAAGVYKCTFAGPLKRIPGSIKVPAGTGFGTLIIDASGNGGPVLRLPLKFTAAVVKGGGRKISYNGRVIIPARLTQGLGSVSGPFSAEVSLVGAPRIQGSARLSVGSGSVRITMRGSK